MIQIYITKVKHATIVEVYDLPKSAGRTPSIYRPKVFQHALPPSPGQLFFLLLTEAQVCSLRPLYKFLFRLRR